MFLLYSQHTQSTKTVAYKYAKNKTLNTQDTNGKAGKGNIKEILRQKL